MQDQHFFCLLTPARADMHKTVTPAEMAIFGAHGDYLTAQFAANTVLQAGTSFEDGEEHFALVILKAKDKAAAVALMNADPAVAQGLLKARVTAYNVFLDHGLN